MFVLTHLLVADHWQDIFAYAWETGLGLTVSGLPPFGVEVFSTSLVEVDSMTIV